MGNGKEVAVPKTGGAVATYDYGTDAGAGFEGLTSKDMSIPFLAILQSNSPQVEDKTVEGAESGMLINTLDDSLYAGDKGIGFIPVHFEEAFVEWKPRTAGGGFVSVHDVASDLVKAELAKVNGRPQGKIILPNGNELIQTFYAYGLVLNEAGDDVEGFAVVSFTSTKIKPFRDWRTQLRMLNKGQVPLFANRARLKTFKTKNEKGTFHNFDIVPFTGKKWPEAFIAPDSALFTEAKNFRELVVKGVAKAAHETQNKTGDGGNGSEADAPF